VAQILKLGRDWTLFLGIIGLSLLVIAKLDQREQTVVSGAFFVIDGDTLSIDGRRLRLAGIDAPELSQTCERRGGMWDCGREARRVLAGLRGDAGATRCSGNRMDRYQRLLVYCQNGPLDINAEMVLRGMAVAYGDFAAQERAAKAGRIGIWSGPVERPQDWRQRQGIIDDGALRPTWRDAALGWLGLR